MEVLEKVYRWSRRTEVGREAVCVGLLQLLVLRDARNRLLGRISGGTAGQPPGGSWWREVGEREGFSGGIGSRLTSSPDS